MVRRLLRQAWALTPPLNPDLRRRHGNRMLCLTAVALLLITACSSSQAVEASTYYVSTTTGTSSGSGTSPASACSDLASVLAAASAGSTISLCRSDIFKGVFSAQQPSLTINSYACNAAQQAAPPLLTSAAYIAQPPTVSHLPSGQQLWVFNLSAVIPAAHTVWALWINSQRYMVARWPNLLSPTVLYGQSSSEFSFLTGSSSATSCSVSNATLKAFHTASHWVNATIRIRDSNWAYSRHTVTRFDAATASFAIDGADLTLQNPNQGFFLENKQSELDQQGEYFFDPATRLLSVIPDLSTATPADPRRGASVDSGAWVLADAPAQPGQPTNAAADRSAVLSVAGAGATVTDIALALGFSGLNLMSAAPPAAAAVSTISNVSVRSMLAYGMKIQSNSSAVRNSSVSDCDVYGIKIGAYGHGSLSGVQVQASTIQRIALVAGYSFEGSCVYCCPACSCRVAGSRIEYCGFAGVQPGSHSVVQNNFIDHPMVTFADGGNVYASGLGTVGNVVAGNRLVLRAPNPYSSAPRIGWGSPGAGVYMDDCSSGWTVTSNHITYISSSRDAGRPRDDVHVGLRNHNSRNNVLAGNQLYGASAFVHQDYKKGGGCPVANLTFASNFFNARAQQEQAGAAYAPTTTVAVTTSVADAAIPPFYASFSGNLLCGFNSSYPFASFINYTRTASTRFDPPLAGNAVYPLSDVSDCSSLTPPWSGP